MRKNSTEALLSGLDILIADSNAYMRRLLRTMLMNLGARSVLDAADGPAALHAIRSCNPDIMLLDCDLPGLNAMAVVRMVRSPGDFPRPDIPIIMLASRASLSAVTEAMQAGVHEFLIKPTSPKALRDRLAAILYLPRRMTRRGAFYGPEPRRKLESPKAARPA